MRGKHPHTKSLGDACHLLPDAAKAINPHRFAGQFSDRAEGIAEILACTPAAFDDAIVVGPHPVGQCQQQSEGVLGNRVGAIAYGITDNDVLLGSGFQVDIVVAAGGDADAAQARQGSQDSGIQHGFVDQQDISSNSSFKYGIRRSKVIDGQLAQRLELLPAQVARVESAPVEDDDSQALGAGFAPH